MAVDIPRLDGAVIVFDLDGTLVDTAPDLTATLNFLLAAEGLAPVTLASARTMIGRGGQAMMVKAFAASGRALAEPEISPLYARLTDHYLAHIADESRPFPGAVEVLDTLTGLGALLAVCTNKRTKLAVALLEALGLGAKFAAVVGPDRAPAAKPDARHLLAAVALAGGKSGRAVMVGDSASDALSARAAAIPLVLVDFGYTETPARDLAPDVLISRFDELPPACARLLSVAAARPCPSGARAL